MVNRRLIAACWVVRLALAASFLSAVADRLGLWGPPGAADVAWGSVPKYQEYVAQLNWFLPAGLVPVVGWAATACEVMLAIGLLIGWRLHWVAFVAGILLTAFAVMMAVALGPKPPLDYSVPSAAGAAFLLAALTCTTSPRTTHIADDDVRVIRDNLPGIDRVTTRRLVPFWLFTDPELARVGLSESEAKSRGIAYRLAMIALTVHRPLLDALRTTRLRYWLRMRLLAPRSAHPALQPRLPPIGGIKQKIPRI